MLCHGHYREGIKNTSRLELEMRVLKGNVDSFFLIVMGCIVFLMQCGFAFLEAGSVRYLFIYSKVVDLAFIKNISCIQS